MNRKRPSLLEMIMADTEVVREAHLLYPFPELIAITSETDQLAEQNSIKEDQRSVYSDGSDSEDSLTGTVVKSYEMAGLESCKWTQDELKRWVEARRKRFPSANNQAAKEALKEEELSNFEKKLRLKLMILSDDPEKRRKLQKERRFLFKTATVSSNRKPKHLINEPPQKQTETNQKEVNSHHENDAPEEHPATAPEATDSTLLTRRNKMDALTPADIIQHLKRRKTEDAKSFSHYFETTPKGFDYNYTQNTLFVNVVMDQILEERNTILSMLSYIVDHNFLQPKSSKNEQKE